MKLSDLIGLFAGRISSGEMAALIENEVSAFKNANEKTGSSMDVVLVEHGERLEIGVSELKMLCRSFLNGELGQWQMYYICDALLMAQCVDFADDEVRNAFEVMTDPDVNGELTKDRVDDIERAFS